MNVLVLGGSGMLGHKLAQVAQKWFDVTVSLREPLPSCAEFDIFKDSCVITDVRAEELDTVGHAVEAVRPDVIVNCIGIVKQSAAANDPIAAIKINSLFPHRLAQLARDANARLIQVSTDCVFSGRKGSYTEDDAPDADDLYGRTKLLGEVTDENCLTIRTSMIGRELANTRGLLEWFVAHNGSAVRGFRRAIFSGLTTLALSEILVEVIRRHTKLRGVWHVASHAISKYDLLRLVQKIYALEIEIEPDDSFVCDRSLNGSRLEAVTGMCVPSWPQMIEQMHADATPYEEIRRLNDSRRQDRADHRRNRLDRNCPGETIAAW